MQKFFMYLSQPRYRYHRYPAFAPKLEGDSLMCIYKYGEFNRIIRNIEY